MKQCCKVMRHYATTKNTLLEYSPETRSYDFWLYEDPGGTRQPLHYCPWCGKKLPKDLGGEWAEMIKKEYKVSSVFELEWADLPKKFKTDEWWKKRGL